jgi:hypothetical protein
VADEHGIIAGGRELPVGLICDGNIVEEDARFEFEGGDDSYGLGGDEAGERVLWL